MIASSISAVAIRGVTKRYGDKSIFTNLDLDVQAGEFFTLLGPSGCGKTTLLRLIAGLESPDHGDITIAGQCMTNIPPQKRPVHTVFQNYALFPHLNVFDNVAFGLRMQGRPKKEITNRVDEMLAWAKLEQLRQHKPQQLSGGQQQRVALVRALINRPSVLLLDEPFSALDAKLRQQMQSELKQWQRELGITFILVTHDQEEALALSDRIAVLHEGAIQQIGTPQTLYEHPANLWTANFIGENNIFTADIMAVIDEQTLEVCTEGHRHILHSTYARHHPKKIHWMIRPEHIRLSATPSAHSLSGRIITQQYKGAKRTLVVALTSGKQIITDDFHHQAYSHEAPVYLEWNTDAVRTFIGSHVV